MNNEKMVEEAIELLKKAKEIISISKFESGKYIDPTNVEKQIEEFINKVEK